MGQDESEIVPRIRFIGLGQPFPNEAIARGKEGKGRDCGVDEGGRGCLVEDGDIGRSIYAIGYALVLREWHVE